VGSLRLCHVRADRNVQSYPVVAALTWGRLFVEKCPRFDDSFSETWDPDRYHRSVGYYPVMRRKLRYSLLLLLATIASVGAKEINILFVGNSFTFRHDLPNLVKTVFEEGQPDLNVNVDKVVYGGQDLFRHHDLYFSQSAVRLNSITIPEIETYKEQIQAFLELEEAPEFYNEYWSRSDLKPQPWKTVVNRLRAALKRQDWMIQRIRNNQRMQWDFVVLQSWQDIVEDPNSGYAAYAKKWAQIAKEEGAEVILYITAPYAQNATPVEAPLNPEQVAMEMSVVRKLADTIDAYAVVPVPLAIQSIQEGGTDLTFCYVNDFHPNQTCAFLTANMFYAAFFMESTGGFRFDTVIETNDKGQGEGKDPDGGDAKVVFGETTKSILQKAAFDGVMQFYGSHKGAL